MGRMFNRLKLSQAFLLLGIVATLMIAIPSSLLTFELYSKWKGSTHSVEGMAPLQAVNITIQSLQTHRGTSAAMLGGDKVMTERRPTLRDTVNRAFDATSQSFETNNTPREYVSKLANLRQVWINVERNVADHKLTPAEAIDQHSVIVRDLMTISSELAEVYELTLASDVDAYALTNATLMVAPRLSEYMSLLRCQGAGYLAAHDISGEDRGVMIGLMSEVRNATKELMWTMDRAILANPQLRGTLSDTIRKMQNGVDTSLRTINTQVVQSSELNTQSTVYFDTMSAAIESVYELSNTGTSVLHDRLTEISGQMEKILVSMAIGLFTSFVIVMLLMIAYVRHVNNSMNQAVTLAKEVANGNLHGNDVSVGTNEVGMLIDAQQNMRSTLRPVVERVRNNADSVAAASSEISSGSNDLSIRTEQQAASLEETAAAMEQLSVTVRNNADSARSASDLAEQARQIANQGGTTMTQVVDTMQEITKSSTRIADIIGVIDSIAFQTNILALNAAVEAARAGEQGRGFAVVASEVRALAHRSADAAKEIKQLIEASVSQVTTGNAYVVRAGETMQEVVQSITKVQQLTSAISDASQEQSAGVSQVSTTIVQMDQATQQNAALVEELVAAAMSLQQQGQELVSAVSAFKVN